MHDFFDFVFSAQFTELFYSVSFCEGWWFGGEQRGRSIESGDDKDWFICLSLYQQTSFGKSSGSESILFGGDKDWYICLSLYQQTSFGKSTESECMLFGGERTSSFVCLCQQTSSVAKHHGFATLGRGAVWSSGRLTLPWQPT